MNFTFCIGVFAFVLMSPALVSGSQNEEKERAVAEYNAQLLSQVPTEYLQEPDKSLVELCAQYNKEIKEVRTCTYDSECGQVLEGTGCGCTRTDVARKNADLAIYSRLRQLILGLSVVVKVQPAECSAAFTASICDCPEADGFVCVSGLCRWHYANKEIIVPGPEAQPPHPIRRR